MTDHPSLPFTKQAQAIEVLNQISIFGGLSESDLFKIFRLLKEVTYKADEIIFEQDSDPDHIYIVLEGHVKISSHSAEHPEEIDIAEMGIGQCFGEISVIGILPHTGRARATQDSLLLLLSSQALFALHEEDADLFSRLVLNIAREACRRLYKTNEILLHYAARAEDC